MRMKFSQIAVLLFLCIGIFLIKYFHLTDYVSLTWLHANIQTLNALIQKHYLLSVLVFIDFIRKEGLSNAQRISGR